MIENQLLIAQILSVFRAVLDQDLSGEDDFFEAGGTSILAAHAAAMLGDALDQVVPPYLLFEAPSAREIARRLMHVSTRADMHPGVQLFADSLPASYQQEQIWISEQIDPESRAAYVLEFEIEVDGTDDVTAVRKSIHQVVEGQPAFRTSFFRDEEDRLRFRLNDVAGVDSEVVTSHVEGEALPDPTPNVGTMLNGPLYAMVIAGERASVRLRMAIHHSICDATSAETLLSELALVCRGSAVNHDASEYAAHALRQRTDWHERSLSELDVTLPLTSSLRFDRTERSYASRRQSSQISGWLLDQIDAEAQRRSTTPFALIAGSLGVALCGASGEESLTLGVPVNLRNNREQQLVGYYVNVVPLVVESRDDVSVTTELIGTNLHDAMTRSDVPFRLVIDGLRAPRSHAENPIYQVLVSYHDRIRPIEQDRMVYRLNHIEESATYLDLRVSVERDANGARVAWIYDPAAISSALLDQIIQRFASAIKAIATQDGDAWAAFRQLQSVISRERDEDLVVESSVSAVLRSLWQRTLNVTAASAGDDFFASGGTSIAALRLVGDVNDELGVRISLRDFYRDPRLGALAVLCSVNRAEAQIGAAEDD